MMHKPFEELYPEEKEFVLQHLDSVEEYESMRKTLQAVLESNSMHNRIEPRVGMKEDLLAELGKERRGGFVLWLNGLFAGIRAPELPLYRRPAYQLAFASVLIAVGLFVFLPESTPEFAEARPAEIEKKLEDESQNSNTETTTHVGDEDLEIENQNESNVVADDMAPEEATISQTNAPAKAIVDQRSDDLTELPPATNNVDDGDTFFSGSATLDEDFKIEEDVAMEIPTMEDEMEEALDRAAEMRDEQEVVIVEAERAETFTESLSTRSITTDMVEETQLNSFQIDDQMGNVAEVQTISGIESAAATDFSTDSGSLISAEKESPPTQIGTKKYRDLFDLLHTSM